MLPYEMEDDQVMFFVLVAQFFVVIIEQSLVELVQFVVACVEHGLRKLRVVEEKTAAEVINSFLGLWQELVSDERYMIAGLAEKLRKQWIVARHS